MIIIQNFQGKKINAKIVTDFEPKILINNEQFTVSTIPEKYYENIGKFVDRGSEHNIDPDIMDTANTEQGGSKQNS